MTPKAFLWEKIQIRIMTEEDLPILLEANHDPDIEQLAGGIFPVSADELREFYKDEMKEGSMCFMIESRESGETIGEVSIYDIRNGDKTGEISIILFDAQNHQKWYGSDALNVILRYGFDYLSLRKLIAWIYAPNIASIKLFEKYGFECTGRHRAHRLYRWRYEDTLLYEKFRDGEYQNALGDDMR